MKKVVIYARVSSKEQEREGYSIPAQIKLLQEYAANNNLTIVKEFTDSETAKRAGRTNFNEMLKLIRKDKSINTILVEKTDRLYRNFKDYVILDEFKGLEIHLVKEATTLSESSNSNQKFMHGIKVLMAKNYIDNLSEEVKKGFKEKAEQGNFPMKPPYGYKRDQKNIIIDTETSPYIKRAFEVYSQGNISMKRLVDQLSEEGYIYKPGLPKIPKGQLERLLKNRFYAGQFLFKNKLYQGNHEPLVSTHIFEATQRAFRKDNKPEENLRYKFNFSKLLKCGECGCVITAELKKKRYVYYHCTHKKGTCSQAKYIKEESLEEQFADAVKKISMTPEHKEAITLALKDSFVDMQQYHSEKVGYLRKEATKLENRINMIYADKLDGKISEEFWLKKHNEFNAELIKTEELIICHAKANKNYMERGNELLELAENAYSKYLGMSADKKVIFLNYIGSNFSVKDGKLSYTYEKPFDILAEGLNRQLKRGGRGSNPRPPA